MLQKPDVVAFSCYIWSGEMVQDFARAIKQINPHIKIILGGVEVHQDLLTENVDFIVNGEGEVAFKEIIDYLNGRQTLKEAIEKIKLNTHDYVRRQDTWFRKNKDIKWVSHYEDAEKLIQRFLKK